MRTAVKHGVLRAIRLELERHVRVKRAHQALRNLRHKLIRVRQVSPYANIFHCCTQKTASQWFKSVFNDPAVYRYTGLRVYPCFHFDLRNGLPSEPLPPRTFVAHMYTSYPVFLKIPKPKKYKAFFVMRDPRDIVVSWYFSAKYSQPAFPHVAGLRRDLNTMDVGSGMRYIIDRLDAWKSFETQRTWMAAGCEEISIFRYEDLSRDNWKFLENFIGFLGISMPERELRALHERQKFERHSRNRMQGQEDSHHHYRKGVSGDWRNYFDGQTGEHFRKVTGDLLEVLGYGG